MSIRITTSLMFLCFFFLTFVGYVFSQEELKDELWESKIDSAWDEIRSFFNAKNIGKAKEADNPQYKYSEEFYSYFLSHKDTPTGERALGSAFTMFGNIGAYKKSRKALEKIPDDSNAWQDVIHGAYNAFYRAEKEEDFFKLLADLEKRVTNPKGQAMINRTFGKYYIENKDNEKAREYFLKNLELAAFDFSVSEAQAYLYEIESLNVGQVAPNFVLNDLKGNEIDLQKLKGKIIVLDFWATWCGPCIGELPYLKESYKKFKDNDVVFISISLDRSLEDLTEFLEKEEMDWIHIFADGKWESKIAKLYNIRAIPRIYIVDRVGNICAKDPRKDGIEKMLKSIASKL